MRNIMIWSGPRVGDVVMTFPALKLIKAYRPQTCVTYVTTDYSQEVAELSGMADRVYPLRFGGGWSNFWRYRRLRKDVKAGRVDCIFVFGKATRYASRIGPIEETV